MLMLRFPNPFPPGMKTAPEESPGDVSAGSGDRIRTYDLWVMSQLVGVSRRFTDLKRPRHDNSLVRAIAAHLTP